MPTPETHGARAPQHAHPRLVEVADGAPLLETRAAIHEAVDAVDYVPPNGFWPLVVIAGRYGYLGCENKQTLHYRGILRSTAWSEAKRWFGACPRVINYYDDQGRLVMVE